MTAVAAALGSPGVRLSADALIALRPVALQAARAAPVLAALPGGFASRRKGQGQEVADVRELQPGDDIRHLDRAATARTGRLHIRQFQEDRDRVRLLVADFRAPMFWGVSRAFLSVVAAEALTLLGWALVEAGGRVALLAVTPGAPVVLTPRGRTRGMLDVIGTLARAHNAALEDLAGQGGAAPPPVALDQALAQADRLCPPGAEIVLASGFDAPGADLRGRLDGLARRRHPHLIEVTDAQALPRGRYPVRLSDGRRLRLDLGGQAPARDDRTQVAGRTALRVFASDPVPQMARQLAALTA